MRPARQAPPAQPWRRRAGWRPAAAAPGRPAAPRPRRRSSGSAAPRSRGTPRSGCRTRPSRHRRTVLGETRHQERLHVMGDERDVDRLDQRRTATRRLGARGATTRPSMPATASACGVPGERSRIGDLLAEPDRGCAAKPRLEGRDAVGLDHLDPPGIRRSRPRGPPAGRRTADRSRRALRAIRRRPRPPRPAPPDDGVEVERQLQSPPPSDGARAGRAPARRAVRRPARPGRAARSRSRSALSRVARFSPAALAAGRSASGTRTRGTAGRRSRGRSRRGARLPGPR